MTPAARRAHVLDVVRTQVLGHRDAFYVVDLAQVARKYAEWTAELPRVRPYYAVKCNDDPRIVETLASLGAGFDCASKGEMSMALGLGVAPRDIIFAHPAKQPSHLQYARKKGVTRMTFDNEDELRKIAREHPGAEAVLRILTDDSHSVCRLGLKFGCPPDKVAPVLRVAKELGVNVVGVSYHVGSGNGNAASFGDAVREARRAFDVAAEMGFVLKLLDIGGGFPGSEMGAEGGADTLAGATADVANPYSKHPSFKSIAAVVRGALDTHFPPSTGVTIIAEPGRFFVKSSHVLAVNVVGKRKTEDEAGAGAGPRWNYYVNDGLYGSFNCVLYDHVTCAPSLVLAKDAEERGTIALGAARAAVADDSIVRLSDDGTPIITDVIGVTHAEQLRDAMEPVLDDGDDEEVDVLAAVRSKRMAVGGGAGADSGDEAAAIATMSAAGGALAAALAASGATGGAGAAPRGAAGVRTTAPRRSYTYTPLNAAPVATTHVAAAAAAAAAPSGATRSFPTTIWGPTCDSIDKITDAIAMPEVAVGDWLVFENMGAYTIAGSCKFNGFPLSTKVYLRLDGTVEVQSEEITE